MTYANPLDELVARTKLPISVRFCSEGVFVISNGKKERCASTIAGAKRCVQLYRTRLISERDMEANHGQ